MWAEKSIGKVYGMWEDFVTRKYVVPEDGLRAFLKADIHEGWLWDKGALERMLLAFIAWQSENPIVPTRNQAFEILQRFKVESSGCHSFRIADALVEWQRRMYLSPEPEVPKEVKDLLQIELTSIDPKPEHTVLDPRTTKLDCTVRQWNEAVLEAYRRGKESR